MDDKVILDELSNMFNLDGLSFTLQIGNSLLPHGYTPLTMAYDWLAEMLYIGGRNTSNIFSIMRSVVAEGAQSVFTPVFESQVATNASSQMTVNPLTG